MFGRYPVMVASTWFMVAWVLGCALSPSMPALIVFRLLAGTGGSAAMTIAPAVCADMYPIERRVRSTAIITMAQTLGPTLGPLVGSFVGDGLGWRWNYWLLLICGGVAAIMMTLFMKESYAPFILRKKTERLRKEHGRNDLRALMSKDISRGKMLQQAIVRPTKLLTRSVIASLVCLYVAIVYGCMYLWFTTIPTVFEDNYGWSNSLTGLAYLGIGIGMLVSVHKPRPCMGGTN
jgi:MFS family permease